MALLMVQSLGPKNRPATEESVDDHADVEQIGERNEAGVRAVGA
jgi:hypothetical protein